MKTYQQQIVFFCLVLFMSCFAQIRLKENNLVSFKGSLAETKLLVKNMGMNSSADFFGPKKTLPANAPYSTKEDDKKKWVYTISKGNVFSGNWVEAPEGYTIQINTPFGILLAKKQVQFYMIIREDQIKIVVQKGKVQFFGAIADQFTMEHNETDVSVNYILTIPDKNTRKELASAKKNMPKVPSLTPIPNIPKNVEAPTNVQSPPVATANNLVAAKDSTWQIGAEILHYDSKDPVMVGESYNYIVKITNQKDVPIKNLKLTSFIPDQAGFATANAQRSGQVVSLAFQVKNTQVVFDSLPELAPSQTISYTLNFKAKDLGVSRHIVQVHAEGWEKIVQTEEITQIK